MRATSIILVLGLLLAACKDNSQSEDILKKTGDAAEGERPGLVYTHFSDTSELFVEFDALAVGAESPLAAHFNDVSRFKPIPDGKIVVVLSGGSNLDEVFTIDGPSVPGIFRPVVIPKYAGERRLTVTLVRQGKEDKHDLGPITVFASESAAIAAAKPEAENPGEITYLKEQAWKTEFATAEAVERILHASVSANGLLRAPNDGDVTLIAQQQGRLLGNIPHVGQSVKKGEILAHLAPMAADSVDLPSLELAEVQAKLKLEDAEREHRRAQDLVAQAAVPEKRLHEAENQLAAAKAEVRAAGKRLDQMRNSASGSSASRLALRAPIAGVIAEVPVSSGSLVQQGQTLFRVVKTHPLWLEVAIPEAEVMRVTHAKSAWFTIDGVEKRFAVGPESGGRALAFGGVIDTTTRTAPLLFELPNPDGALKVGMHVRARVATGDAVKSVAVPASSIVDDGGQEVVFVQTAGESFERRPVSTGIRDSDWVQVHDGVALGERVVSKGAYQVKLASAGGAVPAHGHAH